MTTADAFFDEATPPPDMEWTTPRLQPEVDPVSSSPWFVAMGAVALGVILRLLMFVEVLEAPELLFGLGWTVSLSGCAAATILLARSREALTGRHIADVVLLGFATAAFAWLFPHDRGAELIDLPERIGNVALHASAGWLVGSMIALALARARTSVSRVSLLLADGIALFGALFMRDADAGLVGLALLLAAWAFAIAGWNERVHAPTNQGPPNLLRSPRSMVSFATALTAATAIAESFTRGLWADQIPMLFLLGLLLVAAIVAVVDGRRQMAAVAASANEWNEWRSSVETGALADVEGGAEAGAGAPSGSPFAGRSTTDTTEVPVVGSGGVGSGRSAEPVGPGIIGGEGGSGPDQLIVPATALTTTAPGDPSGASPAFIPAAASASPAEVISTTTSSLPFRTQTELQAFPAASAWTDDGQLLGANAAFWDLCGTPPGEAFSLLEIVHPEDRPALALHLARGTRTNLPFRMVVRLAGVGADKPGYRLDVAAGPYQAESSPLGDVPAATYQVSLNGPVEERTDPEALTADMFDPLTGLGNSAYLEHWITERGDNVRRRTDRPLLVILELAHLGQYEQSEPRLRDLIQTEVAYALHSACRAGDFIVRLDGPYFAAVIEGVVEGDEWYVLRRFEEIVQGTISIAGRTYKVDGRLLPLRPNPGATLADILDQVAALLVAPADLVPSVPSLSGGAIEDRTPGPGQQVMLGLVGASAGVGDAETGSDEPAWGAASASADETAKPVLRAVPEPEDTEDPSEGDPKGDSASADDADGDAEQADSAPTIARSSNPFALSGHAVPPAKPMVITPISTMATADAEDEAHETGEGDGASEATASDGAAGSNEAADAGGENTGTGSENTGTGSEDTDATGEEAEDEASEDIDETETGRDAATPDASADNTDEPAAGTDAESDAADDSAESTPGLAIAVVDGASGESDAEATESSDGDDTESQALDAAEGAVLVDEPPAAASDGMGN